MGKNLSIIIGLFIILFLSACSDDKEFNHKNQDATEEIVQIEQNDEKQNSVIQIYPYQLMMNLISVKNIKQIQV